MDNFNKRASVLAGLIMAVMVVNVAWAAWLSSGAGTGTATATTQDDGVTLQVGDVSAPYPGWSDTLTVTVPNGNDYAIGVTELEPGVSANGTCDPINLTVESKGAGGEAVVLTDLVADENDARIIAAGGTRTYELEVEMAADADDDCQGAVFTIEVDAVLSSAAHLSESN